MPQERTDSTDKHLHPNPRENHPLPLGAALKKENVGGVGVKGGREIDQQESHLMDVPAVMLAGETVPEFVDRAEHQKEDPERPDVVAALIRERIERSGIVLDSRPIAREQ